MLPSKQGAVIIARVCEYHSDQRESVPSLPQTYTCSSLSRNLKTSGILSQFHTESNNRLRMNEETDLNTSIHSVSLLSISFNKNNRPVTALRGFRHITKKNAQCKNNKIKNTTENKRSNWLYLEQIH